MDVLNVAWWIFAAVGFLALSTYLLPVIMQQFFREQDLKQKYGAEWALVTGGSSGIGKAIVRKLATQKINVVIVALPDKLLEETLKELRGEFKQVKFIPVGVNLGAIEPEEYMKPIRDATKNLQVRLVFNNAGFILPGIFHKMTLEKHMANYNCNATSSVVITHEFAGRITNLAPNTAGKRGLISFTSSSAGFLPTPISTLYGATKCFLTSFASAIGTELKEDGVDVVCVHPSPIQSRFYDNAKGVSLITAFQGTALSPNVIANVIFKSAGRFILCDQGYFSIGSKLMLKAIDWNFLSEIAPIFMKSNPDFRRLKDDVKAEKLSKEE